VTKKEINMPKILIVEDDENIRAAFAGQLECLGYETESAQNGKEAVERVQKESFDLILMDLVMPEMDGFEAIRRIREMRSLSFIPIIVVSAREASDGIEKALELGANDYVVKPVDSTAFKARVRAALRLKESVENLRVSEEKYKTLLQALPDIVYKADQDGKFVYLSDSIRSLGYEPEELLGRHFGEIIHPDDVQKVSRSFVLPQYIGMDMGEAKPPKLFDERRSYDRGTRNLEVRLLSKISKPTYQNSKGFFGLVTIACGEVVTAGLQDPHSKNTIHTVGIIRDITDRKQAEEERKKKEELHQRTVENIFQFVPKGLLVFSDKINLLKKNKAFEDIVKEYACKLNYTEQELEEIIIEQARNRILNNDKSEIRIKKNNIFLKN
jgi:CheY-like chemotaxis protein